MSARRSYATPTHADLLLARVSAASKHLASRPQADRLFTVAGLAKDMDLSKRDAYSVIQRLVKMGRAEITGPRCGSRPCQWRFLADARPALPIKASTATDQMWLAMRAMPSFSPTSLATHADVGTAEVTVEAARTYCRALLQAGYLRVIRRASAGNEAVYRLLKRSGPTAPIMRRIQAIVDFNTDETIVLKGGAL